MYIHTLSSHIRRPLTSLGLGMAAPGITAGVQHFRASVTASLQSRICQRRFF